MTAPLGSPLQIGPPAGSPAPLAVAPAETQSGRFQQLLLHSLGDVNSQSQAAQAAVEQSLVGGDITQVEALSAVKKADLALRMLIQVRNQALEAYNEIKQMQL